MALTGFQRDVCRLLAGNRIRSVKPADLEKALASGALVFHEGAIRGAFPCLVR